MITTSYDRRYSHAFQSRLHPATTDRAALGGVVKRVDIERVGMVKGTITVDLPTTRG